MPMRFNPFTGTFDIVGAASASGGSGDPFPPTIIQSGETVTVGPREQMLTKLPVTIEAGGTLAVLADSAHVVLP